jgi:hypothetical protein
MAWEAPMAVDRKEAAKTAAQHHTTLALLEVIAGMANRSDMHHSAQRTGSRIAALCRAEQQRQLKRYDAALARIANGVKEAPDAQN